MTDLESMTLLHLHQARANSYSAWLRWSEGRANSHNEYKYALTMEAQYYAATEAIDAEFDRRSAK